jgi:hypothetical protein
MTQHPRHRWSDKTPISPHKTECECQNGCGIVKVTRHETEGGRDLHWTEYWRDLDRIEGTGTPPCTGRATAVKQRAAGDGRHASRDGLYSARNYPL